jgi:uncharacterized phiE125 gp8 family phage protein
VSYFDRYFEGVKRGTRYRSLKRLTEPVVEPVSIVDAKRHLGVDDDFTDDDIYLHGLITAARIHVENVTDRTLIRTQYQMSLDYFPAWDITLQRPPLIASDPITVLYVSSGSYTQQTFTDFRIDADSTPAIIRPQWNGTWPTARGAENDVVITYWAGYGPNASDVPVPARNAVLMLVAHWYRVREAVTEGRMNTVPLALDALIGAVNWGQYR